MYEKGNNWSFVVKRFKKKHILLNSCNNSEWMNEREQKNLKNLAGEGILKCITHFFLIAVLTKKFKLLIIKILSLKK
jgi:hypothetical protein